MNFNNQSNRQQPKQQPNNPQNSKNDNNQKNGNNNNQNSVPNTCSKELYNHIESIIQQPMQQSSQQPTQQQTQQQTQHIGRRNKERHNKGERNTNTICTELSDDSSRAGGAADTNNNNTQVILTFPCKNKPTIWELTWVVLEEFTECYPGVDILHECRKALAWCRSNPNKQKTAKGMKYFLDKWIERANNSGRAKFLDE